MNDFDKVIDRRNTSSVKWDGYDDPNMLPFWLADMDFECPEIVSKAISKRIEHNIFGYTKPCLKCYESIIEYQKRNHNLDIKKEEIVFCSGVNLGIYLTIKLMTKENDKVMVQTPIYPPFLSIPGQLKRNVVINPLINNDGYYTMDYEDLENKLKNDSSIKCFILCNPHNPVGRSYKEEEILKLVEILDRYNVFLISDEIHSDFIFGTNKHFSCLQLPSIYQKNLVVLKSPTKTFNIAAIKVAYMLIKNPELKKLIEVEANNNGTSNINLFGFEVLKAVYKDGDNWFRSCLDYIYQNFLFTKEYLNKNMPKVKMQIPEATYMIWLDFKEYGIKNICEELRKNAHVDLKEGSLFELEKNYFGRMTLACPRKILVEGLERIKNYLEDK